MRIGMAHAISVVGVQGHPVRIEAALLSGLPAFSIVGLPDAAVSESRERLRAAFVAAGITFPQVRVTVNLSPADTPKSGTGFDLGIAAAILGAMAGSGPDPSPTFVGELGLDGSVRKVRGILPAALAAERVGAEVLVVPWGCASEAHLAGVRAQEVWHLTQVAATFGIACAPTPAAPASEEERREKPTQSGDLADIRGQDEARWALEVAAAGGHHLLMTGSQGIGKSLLAGSMPGILPPLSVEEAVEVASIASAAGEFDGALDRVPPFACPHHTASSVSLIGGGSIPRPGAVSRAHRGVLFMDELPEFQRAVLQALRQPMESGVVEIHRARSHVIFPARFQLVGAANPCRCGRFFDGVGACTCAVRERREYYRRIGGPLLDRFDISIVLTRPSRAELARKDAGEASAAVAQRVAEARQRAHKRLEATPWSRNSQVTGAWLRRQTMMPLSVEKRLDRVIANGDLSLRAVDKIMRVAWTLADLAGRDSPAAEDFHQAFVLRERNGHHG
ncbi:YifB family Mg chelatase-like AAA ATPase [Actinomycetaceae bacterium L2_0104]